MRFDIISCQPDLLISPFSHSILKRAIANKLVEVNLINLRDYATGKQKQLDDYAFGGGAGMVMMIEPIANCINTLKRERTYDEVIYMSPDGELLNQKLCNQFSMLKAGVGSPRQEWRKSVFSCIDWIVASPLASEK